MKGVVNSSFLAIHPRASFLCAVNEVQSFGGQAGGGVSAFAIDPDSGEVSETGHAVDVSMPVCVIFASLNSQ